MTIKQLLKLDAAGLSKLSNDQLKQYFAPYLKAIHPEPVKEKGAKSEGQKRVSYKRGPSEAEKTIEMARRMAEKLGIKMD